MFRFFVDIDPLSKFLWVVLLGISLLLFKTPIYGIIVFLSILLTSLFGTKISFAEIRKRILIISMVPSCLFIFHAIVQPGRKLIDLYFFSITDQGLKIGLLYFFRFASVISASMLFILTTDIRQFMVGLVRIGLPYQLAFVIFLTLRFIPIITEELAITRDAYKVRGLVRMGGLSKRLFLWKRYLLTSVIKGIRLAEKTSIAMESRGFNAYKRRTFVTEFKWSRSGVILNVLYMIFAVLFMCKFKF